MPGKKSKSAKSKSTAALGFEANLRLTADKLCNNMDAAEYKHVVLGLQLKRAKARRFLVRRSMKLHSAGADSKTSLGGV